MNTIAINRFKHLEPMETMKTRHTNNFIIENRKKLADLYFDAVSEKAILEDYTENGKYPTKEFLKEYNQLDNLVKCLARFIMP